MVIPLVLHHLPRHHAEPLLPSQLCLHPTVLLYKELLHKVFPNFSKQSIDYRSKKLQPLSGTSW